MDTADPGGSKKNKKKKKQQGQGHDLSEGRQYPGAQFVNGPNSGGAAGPGNGGAASERGGITPVRGAYLGRKPLLTTPPGRGSNTKLPDLHISVSGDGRMVHPVQQPPNPQQGQQNRLQGQGGQQGQVTHPQGQGHQEGSQKGLERQDSGGKGKVKGEQKGGKQSKDQPQQKPGGQEKKDGGQRNTPVRSFKGKLKDENYETVLRELASHRIFELRKKNLSFPNAKFFCRLCEYHLDRVEDCERHMDENRHQRKKEASDSEAILRHIPDPTPTHIQAVDAVLAEVVEKNMLTPEEIQTRHDVVTQLQECVSKHQESDEEAVTLHMYGSSLSELGLKDSDLNVEVSGAGPSPKLLLKLYSILHKHGGDVFTNVQSDFQAKVPVVRLNDSKTGLKIVIAINAQTAIHTSTLLQLYSLADPRVKPLTVVLRSWAKICHLDRQEEGTLPPFAFGIMVVFFLLQIKPPVLCLLKKPKADDDKETEGKKEPAAPSKEDFLDVEYLKTKAEQWKSENEMSLGELWVRLLQFYCLKFDHTRHIVSIRQEQLMTRQEKRWHSKKLAVEDPFSPKKNLASSMANTLIFEYFQSSLRKAYNYFGLPRDADGSSLVNIETLKQLAHKRTDELLKENQEDPSKAKEKSESKGDGSKPAESASKDSVGKTDSTSTQADEDSDDDGEGVTIQPNRSISERLQGQRKDGDTSNNGDTTNIVDTTHSIVSSAVGHVINSCSNDSVLETTISESDITSDSVLTISTNLGSEVDTAASETEAASSELERAASDGSVTTDSGVAQSQNENCETDTDADAKAVGSENRDDKAEVSEIRLRSPSEEPANDLKPSITSQKIEGSSEDSAGKTETNDVTPTQVLEKDFPLEDTAPSEKESSVGTEPSLPAEEVSAEKESVAPSSSAAIEKELLASASISSDEDLVAFAQKYVQKIVENAVKQLASLSISQPSEAAPDSSGAEENSTEASCADGVPEMVVTDRTTETRQADNTIDVPHADSVLEAAHTDSIPEVAESESTEIKGEKTDDKPTARLEEGETEEEAIGGMKKDEGETERSARKEEKSVSVDDGVLCFYKFTEEVFTGGKGPAVICGYCEKEGHIKANCPDDKLPSVEPLPPLTPHHFRLLDSVIERVIYDFAPSDVQVHNRNAMVKELEQYIKEIYPGACFSLFGSSCNGFGFFNSDLDICMTLKGKTLADIDVTETIECMATKLNRKRGLYNVVAIPTAKVPIVKFVDRNTRLEGDISLYNTLAQRNTKLLYSYSQIDPRVKLLGYAVKVFAKTCDIGDASRGSLSSYGYILMMIHYLQQCRPPVVPVLQELPYGQEKPEVIVEGCNTYFFEDIKNLHRVWPGYQKNTEGPGALWLGFLRYYLEEFDWKGFVVTIRQNALLTKFEKLWNGQTIAVEDPFDLNHNLGGGLSRKMNNYIYKTFVNGRMHFGTPIDRRMELFRRFRTAEEFFFNVTALSDGKPPNDRGCRMCGKIGHLVKDCPQRRGKKGNQQNQAKEKEKEKETTEKKDKPQTEKAAHQSAGNANKKEKSKAPASNQAQNKETPPNKEAQKHDGAQAANAKKAAQKGKTPTSPSTPATTSTTTTTHSTSSTSTPKKNNTSSTSTTPTKASAASSETQRPASGGDQASAKSQTGENPAPSRPSGGADVTPARPPPGFRATPPRNVPSTTVSSQHAGSSVSAPPGLQGNGSNPLRTPQQGMHPPGVPMDVQQLFKLVQQQGGSIASLASMPSLSGSGPVHSQGLLSPEQQVVLMGGRGVVSGGGEGSRHGSSSSPAASNQQKPGQKEEGGPYQNMPQPLKSLFANMPPQPRQQQQQHQQHQQQRQPAHSSQQQHQQHHQHQHQQQQQHRQQQQRYQLPSGSHPTSQEQQLAMLLTQQGFLQDQIGYVMQMMSQPNHPPNLPQQLFPLMKQQEQLQQQINSFISSARASSGNSSSQASDQSGSSPRNIPPASHGQPQSGQPQSMGPPVFGLSPTSSRPFVFGQASVGGPQHPAYGQTSISSAQKPSVGQLFVSDGQQSGPTQNTARSRQQSGPGQNSVRDGQWSGPGQHSGRSGQQSAFGQVSPSAGPAFGQTTGNPGQQSLYSQSLNSRQQSSFHQSPISNREQSPFSQNVVTGSQQSPLQSPGAWTPSPTVETPSQGIFGPAQPGQWVFGQSPFRGQNFSEAFPPLSLSSSGVGHAGFPIGPPFFKVGPPGMPNQPPGTNPPSREASSPSSRNSGLQ